MQSNNTEHKNPGVIIRLVGVVVDVEFGSGDLPSIYNALLVKRKQDGDLILEIQEHVGTNVVRAIAMGSTAGLRRGMPVIDLGEPIQVPIGRETLGRLFNVLGEPIDDRGPFEPKASPQSTANPRRSAIRCFPAKKSLPESKPSTC